MSVGVLDTTAIAYGTFEDTLNSTGWGVLDVVGQETTGTTIDQVFWAVGLLEDWIRKLKLPVIKNAAFES